MWIRLNWHCLALALLLIQISLPFSVCDGSNGDGEVMATSFVRNNKVRQKSIIPLRDDNDYGRENSKRNTQSAIDDDSEHDPDYDDEYSTYDGDDDQSSVHKSVTDENNVQHKIVVEQVYEQNGRPQLIQRPKITTNVESEVIPKSSDATENADVTAPLTTGDYCPKECSCLSDYMDCVRMQLNYLPKVPKWTQTLDLSHNDFDTERSEQFIRNMDNLVDLRLNHNRLNIAPVFVGLVSLQTLELSNNDIREISALALIALPKLTHLNLSRNLIHLISPNTFPKGNLIQKLNLNYNQIDKLDRRALETLVRLNELKINNNRISQLPTGLFTKLKKLKKLSLNGNELRNNLQYATFSNLTDLTSLKLRNNFIRELITGVFHGLSNLSLLDLANNELTEIQKGGLLNITALAKLNLSNNSIQTVGKNCWEFTQKISHLDMSFNQLSEITPGTFDLLTKLKFLNLRGNRIASISVAAFNATIILESLDLSQNRISWTIEDTSSFQSLKNLDFFDLSDNQIAAINKNAFLGLTKVSRLDLRRNNITTIHNGAFDVRRTPALRHLLINSTDLICDCNLLWFYYWVKNNNFTAMGKKGAAKANGEIDVQCAYPVVLRNKRMLQLHKDNFTCHDTPKPQIIDEPKSPILAIKGTNITLECTAVLTVGSNIIFKWKHDNVDIDDAMVETKLRKKDENRLRVKERLIERRREVNRIPLRINVSAPKVPLASSSVSKLKNNGNDDEDDESNDDYITSGAEDDDYESELDQFTDENEDEVIATAEDIEASIPINSTIATSRVTLTNIDRSHGNGRYQCIASNDYGKTYSQKFKLTVASFPVFTKQPANVTVRSSDTVRLDCAVDGDPKPQIYWQFNFGNNFSAAIERRIQVMPGDEVFSILNSKPSDQGVYTCTAENSAGKITANARVVILEPPTFEKPTENKDVIIGESSVLECAKNNATSTEKIRWYKNGIRIQASDRYFLTSDNQLLIIAKTVEKDAGVYTCELENNLGKSIKLSVRSVFTAANEIGGYRNGINVDEMTAIVIITVVGCAIVTSVIWVVIIYQSKKDKGCAGSNSIRNDNRNGTDHQLSKDNSGMLAAVNISMLPKGDQSIEKSMQPMRTATILNSHGVLRSSSGSSCCHSSIGVSDDIFRHYKDDCSISNTPLHQPHRNGTDSEEDDANNDHEALLGTTFFGHYPKLTTTPTKNSDNASFVVQMHDGVDSANSQNDIGTGNTTTAECVDEDNDDGQHSPAKTKTSLSLSSSCQSIPALPFNSSHEFDLNNHHLYNGSVSSNASVTPPLSTFATKSTNERVKVTNSVPTDDLKTVPIKPFIQPVPIGRTKPMIQTNKLNELMTAFKK